MLIWAMLATVLSVILAVLLQLYRRQIRAICRQLAFSRQHRTNLRLNGDVPMKEMNALIDALNEVLEQTAQIYEQTDERERRFREIIVNLSHDIRTPLTSLDGYFQLLQESGSEEERQRYTAVIQSRIVSLKSMLEEMFTYTKLQDDGYKLALEPVDMSRLTYSTALSFYEECRMRHIEPDIGFCEESLMILGNEEALRRVLQNLWKNALEHGTERLAFALRRQEDQAVFVCENDVAKPEEIDIDQIFERFYKADSARTHRSTGLGLSIARELTLRMGGEMRGELDGNTFRITVTFPVISSRKAEEVS